MGALLQMSLGLKGRNNRVHTWGCGFMGQLGHGDRSSFDKPRNMVALDGGYVTQLALGPGDHAVALTEKGDVYCWGSGVSGQLGHGHLRNETVPVKVEGLPAKEDERPIHVSAGWSYSALVTDRGNVYTWGWGEGGRLGHGDTVNQAYPRYVAGFTKWRVSPVASIACGYGHCLAITQAGDVLAWGNGTYGELGMGQGDTTVALLWGIPRVVPALAGTKIVAAAAGAHHSCCVAEDGSVYSWGSSADGQLGRPAKAGARFDGIPQLMEDADCKPIKGTQVACGFTHTLVLSTEGDVYGCGSNLSNQLCGGDAVSCYEVPVKIEVFEGKNCTAIAAGREHSLVLTGRQEVVAFGCGLSGQLGVGSDNSRNACHGGPVVVEDVSGATKGTSVISASGDFSACITTR